MPVLATAFAAFSPSTELRPWKYELRDPLEDDVIIEVKFCGICHSDIHTNRGEWHPIVYPSVTGHEFTGIVTQVGAGVKRCKPGDRVGVGCMVGSCQDCRDCKRNLEQFCPKLVGTYDGNWEDGTITTGGYGSYVVCKEKMVIMIPEAVPLDSGAPLLCAGITTYSPIKHYGIYKGGFKVGVVGLGGLGHMALQFSNAFGNETWAIGRTAAKKEIAAKLGAKGYLVSTNEEEMKKYSGYFDFLIDTVSSDKPWDTYMSLLDVDGTMITVGAPPTNKPLAISPFSLIMQRKKVGGSVIGGIAETQEMVDFCAEKGIRAWIEKIPCSDVNKAYERVLKSDVKFRFVLDVGNTHPAPGECASDPLPKVDVKH